MRFLAADFESMALAARALRAGELVAFPTETVYGLGGDATNDRAVAAIFAAKARPSFNPLIVHIPKAAAARQFVHMPREAELLAEKFWPGPLTMVLPRLKNSRISLLASAGLDSVALRVPRHPIAQSLLVMSGLPLAAPSANPSGRLSPTNAGHVADGLGEKVSFIIDGGPCDIGLESTVISLIGEKPHLLRPGPIDAMEIGAVLGGEISSETAHGDEQPRSPGLLSAHYAPNLPLRIDCVTPRDGEAFLGFGPSSIGATLNLSPGGDLREAAANLFAMLRHLDRANCAGIAVAPVPETGLGVAINDRLRRAAASVQ